MNNFFSKKLYLQGLKKIRVSGLALAIIIVLLNAFLPLMGIIDNSSLFGTRSITQVEYNAVVPFCLLMLGLVPIIAHDMFSFLNERNQSDFYHSIPHKRTCVYVSFTAAILTWAFGTVILSSIVNALLWSMARFYAINFATVLLGALPYLVLSVMMAGVMVLAMTVTGTKMSNLLVSILFFLFFRTVSALCVVMLGEMAPVFNTASSWCKYFSIEFFLPYALLEGVFDSDASIYTDAVLQIYSLLVGIGLLTVGGICYNKRRSESATKSAPNKWMQHVYRFAVTLPFVLLIAFMIATDGFESYQLILVIFAVLVYILYELITTRKIKNVIKSIPLMIIPVVAAVLIVSGVSITAKTIENDRFSADEVEGFSFIQRYDNTYEGINTQNIFVSNKEAGKILSDAFDYTVDRTYARDYAETYYQQVMIKLKSGRVIARNLYFPRVDYNRLDEIRKTSREFSESYLKIPKPEDVTQVYFYNSRGVVNQKAAQELYKSFCEEYATLSDADKLWIKSPKGEFTYVVQFGVNGYIGSDYYNSGYYLLFEKMPVTTVKYLNLISENKGYGYYGGMLEEYRNRLGVFASEAAQENIDYAYANIDISNISGEFEDGKVSRTYKSNNQRLISGMYEVLNLILEDDEAFVYDDPDKVYKINLHLEAMVRYPKPVNTEEIELDYNSADFVGAVVKPIASDPEVYSNSDVYIHEDFFVKLDDEKFQQINDILLAIDAPQKTPN